MSKFIIILTKNFEGFPLKPIECSNLKIAKEIANKTGLPYKIYNINKEDPVCIGWNA